MVFRSFVRQGPVDPKQFFKQVDLTAQVSNATRQVEDELGDIAKVIRQPACPDVQIGPQCDDPYTCPLHDHCWAFLPEQNVTTLYRGGKKRFELLDDGITTHRVRSAPRSVGNPFRLLVTPQP